MILWREGRHPAGRVESGLLSTGRVPRQKRATIGRSAVFPVVHTPYDYDERF
jgi:hypothetical protein